MNPEFRHLEALIEAEMAKPRDLVLLLHPTEVPDYTPRMWTKWDEMKHRAKWEYREWRERLKHAVLALRGYRVDYWDD